MKRRFRAKLPWSTSEYRQLEPTDLSGAPPTPEERIRVVAVMATINRDASMQGKEYLFNAEAIRVLLTMDDATWQKSASEVREMLKGFGYDTVEGEKRFNQVKGRG